MANRVGSYSQKVVTQQPKSKDVASPGVIDSSCMMSWMTFYSILPTGSIVYTKSVIIILTSKGELISPKRSVSLS